jgi:hypothetical protein
MIILRSHDQRIPDYFLGVDRDWIECKDRQLWVDIGELIDITGNVGHDIKPGFPQMSSPYI